MPPVHDAPHFCKPQNISVSGRSKATHPGFSDDREDKNKTFTTTGSYRSPPMYLMHILPTNLFMNNFSIIHPPIPMSSKWFFS
jgi:hypothetical protein